MIVVDASVAAKWFLPEPHSDAAALLLDPAYELVAPDLVRLEVGSALLKAVRRKALTLADAEGAMTRLSPPALTLIPSSHHADAAFRIAANRDISIYDGVYVALAKGLDAVLVTSDAKLAKMAKAAGGRVALLAQGPSAWSGRARSR